MSSILRHLLVKLSFIYFETLKKCIRQQSYKNLFFRFYKAISAHKFNLDKSISVL